MLEFRLGAALGSQIHLSWVLYSRGYYSTNGEPPYRQPFRHAADRLWQSLPGPWPKRRPRHGDTVAQAAKAAGSPSAEAYRKEHQISTTGDVPLPEPMIEFAQTPFSKAMKEVLAGLYTSPSPIQVCALRTTDDLAPLPPPPARRPHNPPLRDV